jgi:2-oxoisovalerate dehydrogenase E2 component (dihydrolipoyl transacylase)
MSEFVFKLPDLGEGTVEAEIVEWHVKAGDVVKEDDVIVDVMTDKANVEVPAPVSGTVVRTVGAPGDVVAVGSELIVFATAGKASSPAKATPPAAEPERAPAPAAKPAAKLEPALEVPSAAESKTETAAAVAAAGASAASGRVLTSPAIRRRAAEAGIDLATVAGSGPRGRITRRDFETALQQAEQVASHPGTAAAGQAQEGSETTRIIGVRRMIANRMAAAKRTIPHFSYVEEVDVTALEQLRQTLAQRYPEQPLTYLPFIAMALLRSIPALPNSNAHFDGESDTLTRYAHVHLGIAAQTPDGLKVPVVRHAQRQNLWGLAREIRRVSNGAKDGTLQPAELSGSTVTLTSLGKLGGIASTPVINAPEVAIIGVNKAVDRPVVSNGAVVIRRQMNLSASFDHRIVDGYDAAALIAAIKALIEEPAMLFMGGAESP